MKKLVIPMFAYPSTAAVPLYAISKKSSGLPYIVGDTVMNSKKSKYRGAASDAVPVKLSAVMTVVDKAKKAQIAVYSGKTGSDTTFYCEIDGMPFLVKGDRVERRTEDAKGDTHAFLAYTAALIESGRLDELTAAFNSCMQEAEKGYVSPETAGFLCDSFYFGTKSLGSVFEADEGLLIETVEAAIRSGQLRRSGLFRNQAQLKCVGVEEKSTIKKAEPKTEKDVERELWEKCKAGEFRLDFDWDEDGKKRIRPLSFLDRYVPCDVFFKILKKLNLRLGRIMERMKNGMEFQEAIGTDDVEITICGKPGTGKTQLWYAISAAMGLPVYMSNASHDTDEDEYEGKTKIVNGRPQAVPTEALTGFKKGGIVLIEEANLPQAAVMMGALGQAIEYPFTLKENGYETVNRHPLCLFASTMNVGTAGSKAVSEPFANRFKASYVMDDPNKKAFVDILEKASGQERHVCQWVYNVYEKIVQSLKSDTYGAANTDSILLSLSLRTCIGALQNIEEGSSPEEAIEDSIIGKIAERDIQVAQSCKSVLDGVTELVI